MLRKLTICCDGSARQRYRWAVVKFLLRTLEFAFYDLLICFVDHLSGLPPDSCPPDAVRLYRENLALKVRLDALAAEVARVRGKRALALGA